MKFIRETVTRHYLGADGRSFEIDCGPSDFAVFEIANHGPWDVDRELHRAGPKMRGWPTLAEAERYVNAVTALQYVGTL